ncbi:MAG: hypothetical protein D6731_00175 [Planctomycetota bacterium]|nr:MAG: hypothetical protein D6731_00175 [Planctomycetota bacterium]
MQERRRRIFLPRGVRAAARRAVDRHGCPPAVVGWALAELLRRRRRGSGLCSLGALLRALGWIDAAAAQDLARIEASCPVGGYGRFYRGLRRLAPPP